MQTQLDYVTQYLVQHRIPLTQRNWIELAFFGEKHSIEELEGEELAELPENFEFWPVTDGFVSRLHPLC